MKKRNLLEISTFILSFMTKRELPTTIVGDRIAPKLPAKVGISFSPSGLMTAFEIGASAQLRELGILNSKTALAGSSGGALVALSCALDVPARDMFDVKVKVAKACRNKGSRSTLGTEVKAALEAMVPDNAHEILNSRSATFTLGYSEIYPTRKAHFVNVFRDKADIVSIVGASCFIPMYSTGTALTVAVRDGFAIDGIFATDRARFGCPDTGATDTELIVCPFPPKMVGLDPIRSRYSLNTATCKYSLITPHLLLEGDKKALWPFSLLDITAMAFGPPRSSSLYDTLCGRPISDKELEDKYEVLYRAGQEAVNVWVQQNDDSSVVVEARAAKERERKGIES